MLILPSKHLIWIPSAIATFFHPAGIIRQFETMGTHQKHTELGDLCDESIRSSDAPPQPEVAFAVMAFVMAKPRRVIRPHNALNIDEVEQRITLA